MLRCPFPCLIRGCTRLDIRDRVHPQPLQALKRVLVHASYECRNFEPARTPKVSLASSCACDKWDWKEFRLGNALIRWVGNLFRMFYELWKLGSAWLRKIKIPVNRFSSRFPSFFLPEIIQENVLIIRCQRFLYPSSDPKIPACILRAAINILL
jgi:hypothetical protein